MLEKIERLDSFNLKVVEQLADLYRLVEDEKKPTFEYVYMTPRALATPDIEVKTKFALEMNYEGLHDIVQAKASYFVTSSSDGIFLCVGMKKPTGELFLLVDTLNPRHWPSMYKNLKDTPLLRSHAQDQPWNKLVFSASTEAILLADERHLVSDFKDPDYRVFMDDSVLEKKTLTELSGEQHEAIHVALSEQVPGYYDGNFALAIYGIFSPNIVARFRDTVYIEKIESSLAQQAIDWAKRHDVFCDGQAMAALIDKFAATVS